MRFIKEEGEAIGGHLVLLIFSVDRFGEPSSQLLSYMTETLGCASGCWTKTQHSWGDFTQKSHGDSLEFWRDQFCHSRLQQSSHRAIYIIARDIHQFGKTYFSGFCSPCLASSGSTIPSCWCTLFSGLIKWLSDFISIYLCINLLAVFICYYFVVWVHFWYLLLNFPLGILYGIYFEKDKSTHYQMYKTPLHNWI